MSPKTAPYGTWSSPITADAITQGSINIFDVLVDPRTSEIYHIENRPSEAGRSVLVHTADSGRDVVGEGWNVRTGVQEYGGAPAIVYGGIAYFSHYSDGRVYRVEVKEGSIPEAVTPESKVHRFANFNVHPAHPHILVAILEDHTVDIPSEVVTTICTINTATKSVYPLVSGADFYASPTFTPDGTRIAWQQWFHPDMPWEGAEIYVADVVVSNDKISLKNSTHVAGEKRNLSVSYPSWASNHTLIFTSDKSGYQNPWKYVDGKATPILPEPIPQDFGGPAWLLGWSPYAILDSEGKSALFTATKDGRSVLYLIDLVDGSKPQELDCPYVDVKSIRQASSDKSQVVFTGIKSDEKSSIVLCTLSSSVAPSKPTYTTLKSTTSASGSSGAVEFPPGIISAPRPKSFKVPPNDEPLHVVYYAPMNPEYAGTSVEGEKPPCVVHVHGGPTGLTDQGLDWKKQYFTSRGWAWLDVNYGGSSGYGRVYTDRLVGKWGIVDVEDCILAARSLSSAPYNLIDPARIVIRGGSAGGFTVLAALTIASDVTVFAAGGSAYGVSDLRKLAEDTHKFESKYLDKLIGGSVEQAPQIYKDRSPVFHADKIVSPLLILQGEIDKVVPKEQAEAIFDIIKERGGVVEYKLYPGEGHGWRREENIKDALERELAFYERVLKLKNGSGKL